jgi:hypothetical protein
MPSMFSRKKEQQRPMLERKYRHARRTMAMPSLSMGRERMEGKSATPTNNTQDCAQKTLSNSQHEKHKRHMGRGIFYRERA